MRLHHVFAATSLLVLLASAACVGGPGQLPGEDGQQVLPSGSGSGSAGAGSSSSSSGAGASTPASPGRPPQVDPPVAFDSGAPTKDSGTTPPKDSGTTPTCTNTGQTSKFEPAACQTCLEQQCCTQLRSCFTLVGTSTTLGCNQYNECLDQCVNAADPDTCRADCDSIAATGVVSAFNNIAICAQQKCVAQCQ